MEILQSDRGSVYVKDGFVYHSNNLKGGVRYLRCQLQSCKGRARLLGDGTVKLAPHNHPPDKLARETLLMKSALKLAAMSDPKRKPRMIFKDICKRYPNAAHRLGSNQARHKIFRYRNMASRPTRSSSSVCEGNLFEDLQDEAQETSEAEANSDIASQDDQSSKAKSVKKAEESAKTSEVELQDQESPGPSSIESVPCASTSTIQFVASEITSLEDPEFGSLKESGLGPFVSKTPVEKASNQSRDVDCDKEKETSESTNTSTDVTQTSTNTSTDATQASTNTSTDTTQTGPTSTVVSADITVTKSVKVNQSRSGDYKSRQERGANVQVESECDKLIRLMMSQKKLDTVIDRLEAVADKMTTSVVGDQFEEFGKYVGSLLRGLPIRKVHSLKKRILADVMAALQEREVDPANYLKSIGTQVGFDCLPSEKSYNKIINAQAKNISTDSNPVESNIPMNIINEQSQAKILSTDFNTVMSNIPILGGNMPLIFPGASTSNTSFQLFPVIPMSATTSMVSSATVVSSPSLVGSVPSGHSVPPSSCETVTTVAKSADGTLLAVTIPKPMMCETLVAPNQPSVQPLRTLVAPNQPSVQPLRALVAPNQPSVPPLRALVAPNQPSFPPPRGQKRKQTTAAYLVKKVPCSCVSESSTQTVTTPGEDSSLNRQKMSHSGNGVPCSLATSTHTVTTTSEDSSLNRQKISRTENGTQTVQPSPPQEGSRDSGGGGGEEVTICVPRPMKNEEMEFEMDIEEGKELLQIKQDFETVLCDEESDMYIKEEAPDPEETLQGDLSDPHSAPTTSLTTSAPLICPMCDTQCNTKDDIVRHFSTLHPGCTPSAKDASGGSYFVT